MNSTFVGAALLGAALTHAPAHAQTYQWPYTPRIVVDENTYTLNEERFVRAANHPGFSKEVEACLTTILNGEPQLSGNVYDASNVRYIRSGEHNSFVNQVPDYTILITSVIADGPTPAMMYTNGSHEKPRSVSIHIKPGATPSCDGIRKVF